MMEDTKEICPQCGKQMRYLYSAYCHGIAEDWRCDPCNKNFDMFEVRRKLESSNESKIKYDEIIEQIIKMQQREYITPSSKPNYVLKESFAQKFIKQIVDFEKYDSFKGCPAIIIDDYDYEQIIGNGDEYFVTDDLEWFKTICLIAKYQKREKESK